MRDITDPQLEQYATVHSSPEPPLLQELAEATREFSDQAQMMVGRLQGRFLKMLVAAVAARRVLEVGTFTGYSALSMAEALPPHGRLITCELDERHAEMARGFFARSAHADQIHLELGPAAETLRRLEGPFDFVFIDADKAGYIEYYELALPMLAPGGLLAADNVLASGRVLDEDAADETARAIRSFNEHVAADDRVEQVMVPIRDGLLLVRLS
jgi:caffeoyl-CoA O-methyltransferase